MHDLCLRDDKILKGPNLVEFVIEWGGGQEQHPLDSEVVQVPVKLCLWVVCNMCLVQHQQIKISFIDVGFLRDDVKSCTRHQPNTLANGVNGIF